MTECEPPIETRRMRADAMRNQARILAAAERLFAERGVDVTLDDVAHAAGVGVGTVYRRFANKSELVAEILDRYVTQLEANAVEAVRDPDPWSGLTKLLERSCEHVAGNRGVAIAMTELADGTTFFDRFEAAVSPAVEDLLHRARVNGEVRADVAPSDFFAVISMVHAVAAFADSVRPEISHRYLALLLDGMRPAETRLPSPALTMDEVRAARAALVAIRRRVRQ
ncbi:helix-turn-helix domain-containing protein [Nocardia sp. NPDC004860]|uniref:TetR/AcrR family transcriptional regulator n=1 Tax=Nocardia sp. NPDC004860 TaxID=3154557 RepID=UPI0033B1B8AA